MLVGLTFVAPFFAVMALAVGGLDRAAGGLATLVSGEDCFALCRGEYPFAAVFMQDDILAVPNLAHEFRIAEGWRSIFGMDWSYVDCFGLIGRPRNRIDMPGEDII